MAKKNTPKKTETVSEPIYSFVFMHGPEEKRELKRLPGKIQGIKEITHEEHILLMENEFGKNHINPTIITWTFLRMEERTA